MYVILRDGRVIENVRLHAAGFGDTGLGVALEGIVHASGDYLRGWFGQYEIQIIRFDRDTVLDPTPEPGPDDVKIGTRHNPGTHAYREPDGSITVREVGTRHEAAQAAMRQVFGELDGKTIE